MAPEQVEGRLDLIGPRTDVYGLGAILFEILTGHVPHEEKGSGDVLRHIVSGPTPRRCAISSRRPTPPWPPSAARAMAKAPRDRYADVEQIIADMEHFLADEPVSVFKEPWSVRAERWIRHHRTPTLAAFTALMGVILTSVISAVFLAGYADEERQERLAVENLRPGHQRRRPLRGATIANEIDLHAHP